LRDIFRKVGNGPLNKLLNFGGDLDHRLDTGIVFRIRHYWEIREVLADINLLLKLIRQMAALERRALCLGGGMHCPSASSYCCIGDITYLRGILND